MHFLLGTQVLGRMRGIFLLLQSDANCGIYETLWEQRDHYSVANSTNMAGKHCQPNVVDKTVLKTWKEKSHIGDLSQKPTTVTFSLMLPASLACTILTCYSLYALTSICYWQVVLKH